ncbi:methyl-accepting chemotaxis protein [Saccharospirillum mangrovi]|uniref:methyl-accepting chemotaxis protein n=1 Tax=Saccharospirillum mangrovi TaxID=2161747 RepID=UPI0013B39C99|nr:methyl-accepting chemotaxis protein [Saccharospirillum mangrovi]
MFSRLKIFHRLALLFAMALVAFVGIVLLLLNLVREQMLDDRTALMQSQLDSAVTLLNGLQAQAQSGEMTRAEAQSEAIRLLNQVRYLGDEYIFSLDHQTLRVLQHPSPDIMGSDGRQILDSEGTAVMVGIDRAVTAGGGRGTFAYLWPKVGDNKAQPKLSLGVSYRPWNWTLATGMYTHDIDGRFNQLLRFVLLCSSVVLVALGFLSWLIGSQISGPIRQVTKFTLGVSDDLDLNRRLPRQQSPEVNQIAESLHSMLDATRSVILDVRQQSDVLNSTSEELSQSITTTRGQIQTQLTAIDSIATAIEEMTATFEDVAHNTEKTSELATDVRATAQGGQQQLDRTREVTGRLVSEVGEAAEVIRSLAEEMKSIDDIVDVITNIADQTNLLALNAAIEAARAGEQGRGFAVVADEVRSLANKTQDSTEAIRGKIEHLQRQAEDAFTVMDDSRRYASQTTEQMSEVTESFGQIRSALDQLTDQTQQIAAATTQQTAVIQDINSNVGQINDQTLTTEEQAKAIEASSLELARVANDLSQHAARFQI